LILQKRDAASEGSRDKRRWEPLASIGTKLCDVERGLQHARHDSEFNSWSYP
jgi:hypothetical protein